MSSDINNAQARGRRLALIPASAFNALNSTEDLSLILPNLHGGGSVYLLPPAAPPPELALQIKLEQGNQPPGPRGGSEMDTDTDWATGAVTPVGSSLKRWSMKDLVEDDKDTQESSSFET